MGWKSANYERRPFEPHHAIEAGHGMVMGMPFTEEQWAAVAGVSKIFSGFIGNRLIGFAGAQKIWPGRWEMWAFMNEAVASARDKVVAAQDIRLFIAEMLAMDDARRLETVVPADSPPCIRYAHYVGLDCEALLRHYGPSGEDYWMFRILKE